MITIEEALEVARAECERRGWAIEPEVVVGSRAFRHVVHAALRDHDGCVVVRVSKRTGRVANFIPSLECYSTPEGIFRGIRPCPHPEAGPGEAGRWRRMG